MKRYMRLGLFATAFAIGTAPMSLAKDHNGAPPRISYASLERLPDWSGTWSKPDDFGRPTKDEAALFAAPYRPDYAPVARARIDKGNAEVCLPAGMPGIMMTLGYEFLFTPGRVTILAEEGPLIRRIYTDGRGHAKDADPTYAGDSIGHWEGSTLVVDTTAITAKAQFVMGVKTTGMTHVVERIHLVDHERMQIETLIEDPVALTSPWRYTLTYVRSTVPFVEGYNCDNNRDAGNDPDLTPPAD